MHRIINSGTHGKLLVMVLSILLLLSAQSIAMEATKAAQGSPNSFQVRQTITFDPNDLSFQTISGFDLVLLEGASGCTDIGAPYLPAMDVKVALPEGMTVKSISLEQAVRQDIAGRYSLIPVQPPRPLSFKTVEPTFVAPDAAIYSQFTPYPAQQVELVRQADLAGQSMAIVRLLPLQYIPIDGKLILATSMTLLIEGQPGYTCGDYLPSAISETKRSAYERMINDMVINPDKVQLMDNGDICKFAGVDPGTYDYVIITPDAWTTNFQPLADWKTKKGVPANIVTTEWIFNQGGYTGTNEEKIRAFVIDAHATWGATYYLLGGDTDTVPTRILQDSGHTIATDTYYADYDEDYICEVHVGRASVADTTAIADFIDKTLTYEQDPPLSNYAKNAALFGFDLNYNTHGENCNVFIDDTYIPADWAMSNVYDSHAGDHKVNVMAAINAGQNLLNHIDHSNENLIGVGYVRHNLTLTSPEVDTFTNADKQSIMYSIGCWSAAYDFPACIAEHFVRNANGGCVSYIGNSRYGWYDHMMTDTLSMLYDMNFFKALFEDDYYRLGECFSQHKNDSPTTWEVEWYIFAELTLLGDPDLPIWTENPSEFDQVVYLSYIETGPRSFTVTVLDDNNPVEGAWVCVQKAGEVYDYGATDANGEAAFSIDPQTAGYLDVTVTMQNYLPWEDQAVVYNPGSGGGGPNLEVKKEGGGGPQ